MKIQREKLLTLVNREIQRLEYEEEQRVVAQQQRAELSRERYLRDYLPHWRTFANRLRRAVARGEAIARDLVPPELGSGYSLHWWQEPSDAEVRPVARDLRALRRVLEIAEDEYVSTTGLGRQGFTLGRALRGIS